MICKICKMRRIFDTRDGRQLEGDIDPCEECKQWQGDGGVNEEEWNVPMNNY